MNWGKQTKSELKDGKKLENGKGTKLQTRENIWTFVNTVIFNNSGSDFDPETRISRNLRL